MIQTENIVDLELAKRLKTEGYHKPTEYYWLDRDLPFCPRGLKKTKNGKKMNHNKFDEFIYSAPSIKEAVDFLLGKKMYYESSVIIKIGKNETKDN